MNTYIVAVTFKDFARPLFIMAAAESEEDASVDALDYVRAADLTWRDASVSRILQYHGDPLVEGVDVINELEREFARRVI